MKGDGQPKWGLPSEKPPNSQFCEYSLKFFVQAEVDTFMYDTTTFSL